MRVPISAQRKREKRKTRKRKPKPWHPEIIWDVLQFQWKSVNNSAKNNRLLVKVHQYIASNPAIFMKMFRFFSNTTILENAPELCNFSKLRAQFFLDFNSIFIMITRWFWFLAFSDFFFSTSDKKRKNIRWFISFSIEVSSFFSI